MADAAAEPVPLSGPVVRPAPLAPPPAPPGAPPAGWPAVPGTAGGAWIERHPTLARDAALRAFVQAWLLAQTSAHTRDAYAREIREWLDWLHAAGVDPWQVRRAHADAYARLLETATVQDDPAEDDAAEGNAAGGNARRPRPKYNAGTVRRKITVVSSFYTYLEEEADDWDGRNRVRPTLKKLPRPEPGRTPALTEDEVIRLLRAADAWVAKAEAGGTPGRTRYAHRARALVYALAYLGVRGVEVRNLQIDDLGRSSGRRRARITLKGGRERFRNVPEVLHEVVTAYLAVSGDRTAGPLLVTGKGTPIQRSEVWRILQQIAARAKVRVHPHMLRSTFITVSREHGVDIGRVSHAVGHTSTTQTLAYDQRRTELSRDPSGLVAELYGAPAHAPTPPPPEHKPDVPTEHDADKAIDSGTKR